MIPLDDQQIQRIEQMVMDQDEPGTLRYLEEIRIIIKRKQIGCNPFEFIARDSVDEAADRIRKNKQALRRQRKLDNGLKRIYIISKDVNIY